MPHSAVFHPRRKNANSDEEPGPHVVTGWPSPDPVCVSRGTLDSLMHLPLPEAAGMVGLCPTTFKKACRRFGIEKWPYRPPSGKGRQEPTLHTTPMSFSASSNWGVPALQPSLPGALGPVALQSQPHVPTYQAAPLLGLHTGAAPSLLALLASAPAFVHAPPHAHSTLLPHTLLDARHGSGFQAARHPGWGAAAGPATQPAPLLSPPLPSSSPLPPPAPGQLTAIQSVQAMLALLQAHTRAYPSSASARLADFSFS
ncbi:hypothetical protein T484DRAFT_1983530 [Baffinella frigidus]|nr:hypothetical protein T484DRAFT_1983530 [Cryptophyta sp. CCMP2293]